MPVSTVLFDLDGTLTDPYVGIVRSIRHALEKMGASAAEDDDLRWCIGPPLWESFSVLLGTDDTRELDRAVAFYRERYTVTGLFENALVEGIPGVLENMRKAGITMHVCTSKPHVYASRIVGHFGLMDFFDTVYGAELSGERSAKTDLIAHVLQEEGLDGASVAMIGDRKHDLIGANANDVAGVGVLWGYGSRGELEAEDPVFIAEKPEELAAYFL